MKKIFMCIAASLLLANCGSQEDEPVAEAPQHAYTISFGMGNFDASVESRAATGKTVYGINVYYDKEKDGKQDDIYAYGLFDNTNTMSITLIGGYKYKFVCSLVRDADQQLYYGPYSPNNFAGCAQPFQLSSSASTAIQNKFITGTGDYLSGLATGKAVVVSTASQGYETSGSYPSLERYYGELADYEPKANDRVIIPVKKTFFGNKVVVKGVQDGHVNVSCYIGSTSNTVWSLNNITTDSQTNGSIYSYANVQQCWEKENTLTATVTYFYSSNRGEWWNMSGSKQIVFKRNVMTTITVNLNPDMSGAAIGVNEEPLGDENVITLKGDNGALEVVTVTPGGENNN